MQFGEEPGRPLYDKVSFQDICRRLPNFEFHQMFWQCWPIAIMASLLHASWTILGRFDNPFAISPFWKRKQTLRSFLAGIGSLPVPYICPLFVPVTSLKNIDILKPWDRDDPHYLAKIEPKTPTLFQFHRREQEEQAVEFQDYPSFHKKPFLASSDLMWKVGQLSFLYPRWSWPTLIYGIATGPKIAKILLFLCVITHWLQCGQSHVLLHFHTQQVVCLSFLSSRLPPGGLHRRLKQFLLKTTFTTFTWVGYISLSNHYLSNMTKMLTLPQKERGSKFCNFELFIL